MPAAWRLVALLWFVVLLNYLDRQVIFSLLPLLRRDLALSDTQMGLLATSFLWIYAAASSLAMPRFWLRPKAEIPYMMPKFTALA